jgi:hypothetical protein
MCERVISKQGFCFYLSLIDFPHSTTLSLSTPGSKTLKGARNDQENRGRTKGFREAIPRHCRADLAL